MTASFSEWLPGVAAIANVHPLLVHFPVALYYSFLAAEVLAWVARSEPLRHAASWMLYFGTAGAAAAVAAGFHAADTVGHSEEVHAILERHETYGLTVLALGLLLSLLRWAMRARVTHLRRVVQLALALVLVSVMTLAADLGGHMVYGHAVAVRSTCEAEPEPVPMTEEKAAVPESEPSATDKLPDEESPHRHVHPHAHSHHHRKN